VLFLYVTEIARFMSYYNDGKLFINKLAVKDDCAVCKVAIALSLRE